MIKEQQALLPALARALQTWAATSQSSPDTLLERLTDCSENDLAILPGKGLAHDHVSIADTGLLLRVPKQSQMGWSAQDNLSYQACCFERMLPTGHTPQCYGVLPPSESLPMGALLVQHIQGREPHNSQDFAAIARALASFHSLPVPQVPGPLEYQANAMAGTLAEVEQQAVFLSQAKLSDASLDMIKQELDNARSDVHTLPPSPVCLIAFDAHPGNFLIDATGKAILVDLEKGRYGGCGFDLAHASLYTSTTWDIDICIELSSKELDNFHHTWKQHVPQTFAGSMESYLMPMRRLMWLWSATWCAMWQVQSAASAVKNKQHLNNTRDWAADNNPDKLVSHVKERVEHYLQADTIDRIRQDFD